MIIIIIWHYLIAKNWSFHKFCDVSGVAVVRAGGVHGVDGDLRHGGGRQARQGEGHSAAEVSDSQMHQTFLFHC